MSHTQLEGQIVDGDMSAMFVKLNSNEGYPKVPEDFTIMEKAPTRAFS